MTLWTTTVLKMSPSLLGSLVLMLGAVVEVCFSSKSTTFVLDRDNSTFEIVLQPPRECPEQHYLYKARLGQFFLPDGRDVTKESRKLCIKCGKCADGIKVVRHCTTYQDVVCGSKCVQSGFRFDEGTRSCQHEKVLDEGFTHDELRKWLEEEREKRPKMVSEVGYTSKSTHLETQTAGITEHQHQDFLKTVQQLETSETSEPSTPPMHTPEESGRLFDEKGSDGGEEILDEQTGEDLPRPAVSDHASRLQHLLFITVLVLFVFTVSLYLFAAVRKCRPGLLSRILERQRQLPAPATIEVLSGGGVSRAVTVLPHLRISNSREGSKQEPQLPPDDVSSSDGSYDGNDDDISDNEESDASDDSNLNLPSCQVQSDDSSDDSVEKVGHSIRIRHSPTGTVVVIGDVVVHDGDNIKCDDKGSTDDIGSQQPLGREVGREEDKTNDAVPKRGSTRNEDSFEDEDGMSEEIEAKPSSENETPLIDPVIPSDGLHNDVIATVTEGNKHKVTNFNKVDYKSGNREHYPPDSNECLNATDGSDEANAETKIKEDAKLVSSIEDDATVINRGQSLLNLVVGYRKVWSDFFRKAEGVADIEYETVRETAYAPRGENRRRSFSTNANWMSKIRKEKRNRYSSELNENVSVTDKSYELETEIKIEDTKEPTVEKASRIINAPQSPGGLEAGVDHQVGVKHRVCDSDERKLITIECEILHEARNRPDAVTRSRSSSFTNSMSIANGTRPRAHSTSGDLNPSERKMASATILEGISAKWQSPATKDLCRDQTKDRIYRCDWDEVKKETTKNSDTKVSKLEDASVAYAPVFPRSWMASPDQGLGVGRRGSNTVKFDDTNFKAERRFSTGSYAHSTNKRYEPSLTRSLEEPVPDVSSRSKRIKTQRPRSLPTTPYFAPQKPSPVVNSKHYTTPRIRLTMNPIDFTN